MKKAKKLLKQFTVLFKRTELKVSGLTKDDFVIPGKEFTVKEVAAGSYEIKFLN